MTQRLRLAERENLTEMGIHATGRVLIAHPVGGHILRPSVWGTSFHFLGVCTLVRNRLGREEPPGNFTQTLLNSR